MRTVLRSSQILVVGKKVHKIFGRMVDAEEYRIRVHTVLAQTFT